MEIRTRFKSTNTTIGTTVAWLCNKIGGNLYGCEVKDDDRCDKWEE